MVWFGAPVVIAGRWSVLVEHAALGLLGPALPVTEAVSIVATFETGYAPEVYIDGAATTFASVSTADPALFGAGTHLMSQIHGE
jgi:hypothetical protein